MACIDQSAFKTVQKFTFFCYVLKKNVVIFVEELCKDQFDERLKHLVYFFFSQHILHGKGQVAQNHWQRKVFDISASCTFTPFSFWIILPFLNTSISFYSYFLVIVIFCGFVELSKSHSCKAVWKNAIRFIDRFSFSSDWEIPKLLLILTIVK